MLRTMFNRGHALPLDPTRLLRPRISRGRHAERPREISVPWPEPWHVHDRSPVGNSPRTRFIRVRAQSAPTGSVTNCPHPRTHHGFNSPWASLGRGHELSADSPQSRTVHVRELVAAEHSP